MIRKLWSLLPATTRRAIRIEQQYLNDLFSGNLRNMVSKRGKRSLLPMQKTVQQRITPGPTKEAKLHNMRKAIAILDQLEIPVGGILSFWHLLGEPGARQGFLPGRNIVNGQLVEDFGGGLCQLSSTMYELAIQTGIEVLERHAHSTNVYTPETSYTTLGLDATLAFGYKDLRIRNNCAFPVNFSFELTDESLQVHLCAPEALPEFPIRVEHTHADSGLTACLFIASSGTEKLVSRDFYRAWNP